VGALQLNTTGNYNTAVGYLAGSSLTTGNYNIDIGNGGVAAEGNTIRMGDGNQTRTFISGIRGVTTGSATGIAVLIDANGQLGTVSSSIRYKEDIRNLGEVSSRIFDLRPVSFRYKTQTEKVHYGLIAEEVDQVLPELAVRDKNGVIETVAYHELPPLILAEVQKQQLLISKQQSQLSTQQSQIEALQARTARIEALEAENAILKNQVAEILRRLGR